MKKIIVVLPTYNEEDNISEMINIVASQKNKISGWNLEIVVSDSHSSDNTAKIVKNIEKTLPFVHYLDVWERGIGRGLVEGYKFAFGTLNADAVIQMDADLQHDAKDIPKFVKKLDVGCDFVQGSRFLKGGENRLQWYRKLFSWGANFISKAMMGIWNMSEFTASYRAFTKSIYKKLDFSKIPWKEKSFLFQPAFTYAVSLVASNMAEVPIIFTDRRKGYSKMQIVQYMKDLFLFAIKVRIQKSKKFIKFLTVGGLGFVINIVFLFIFTEKVHLHPAVSNLIAAEMAIISNFIWNNIWTFKESKITTPFKYLIKLFQFNFTSAFGVLVFQTGTIWLGVQFFGKNLYPIYFLVGTAILLIWNFAMYSKVIWKKS